MIREITRGEDTIAHHPPTNTQPDPSSDLGLPGNSPQFIYWAHIKFPIDYPYSPPTFRFLTKMWHPNIYENGDVCISILHPPVDDPQSGELPSERWNPTQNVRTILLSVISLLNEPNTFSPANVDASVMFRKWRDSKGKDKEYAEIISTQVLQTSGAGGLG
uniref:UBC core domain-containing protein n=1 Tax=Strigops habroptila TaxID=2489341 RepID=A0A672TGY0_STRHB